VAVFEPLSIVCGLIVVLGILTLVGHGIWVLLASLWRWLFGAAPAEPSPSTASDREWREIAATRRQLARLVDRGAITPSTFEHLLACLDEPRHEPKVRTRPPVVAASPMPQPPPPIAASEEAILDALPADEPIPADITPEPIVVMPTAPPIARPRRPRRTLTEVLAAFMEEHNILWGELTGGLLIVGCSVALVVYLWQTQKEIRYFPFFVVAGVTGSLFGAGMYSLRRWKLETTSRGLLVIATLLVPLSFLVLAGLSKGEEGGWLEVAIQVVALGVFAWLVSLAGGVLAGPERMPGRIDGRWLLTVAVVLTSGVQLLVPRMLETEQPALWSFALLGLVATACHTLTTGTVLLRARREPGLRDAEAHVLFAFLGMATFPLVVTLGFLVYECNDPTWALERAAVFVALAGVPVLATGVLVYASPVPLPVPLPDVLPESGTGTGRGTGTEEGGLSAPLRTVGTAIALAGTLILLAAVVMAWPNPVALVVVCTVDFAVLSAVAWRCRWPIAHAAALPCLAVGYLTAYHLLTGGLEATRAELGPRLLAMAVSPASGAALTVLAVLFALSAEGLVRLGRRVDAIYHAAGAGVLAVICVLLVMRDGWESPGRAAIVFGVCGMCGLLANGRWLRTWLTVPGAIVCLGAIVYGLHWSAPEMEPARLCLLALLLEATACLAACGLARSAKPQAAEVFGVPLQWCALSASLFALIPLLFAVERDWMVPLAGYGAWLALIWLVLAWWQRWPGLFAAFQAMLGVSVCFAVTAWLQRQEWFTNYPNDLGDPRSLQAYGVGLGLLSILWAVARLLLRRDATAQLLLEPSWPAVDRAVLACLVLGLLLLATFGVAPGIEGELAPLGEARDIAAWPAGYAAAHGPGAWLLLGVLTAALTIILWDRRQHETLLQLLLLGLVVPLLIAGNFQSERAGASALRWGLAICFLLYSAALWFRAELERWASRLRIGTALPAHTTPMLRGVLLVGTVAPVLILTAIAAGLRLGGTRLNGPDSASFFAHIGIPGANLVPLVLVSLGLVGHSIRESSAGYSFAAGLVANLTLMGGYVLSVVTSGGSMDSARWVLVLQLGTFGAGAWAGACLASRRWFAAWLEEGDQPLAKPLMRLQLALAIAGIAVLASMPLGQELLLPNLGLPRVLVQVGDIAGWLALVLCVGVVFWYVNMTWSKARVHVLGFLGACLALLTACAVNTAALPWVSYHVILAAGAVYALLFLAGGIVAASLRMAGLGFPSDLLRETGVGEGVESAGSGDPRRPLGQEPLSTEYSVPSTQSPELEIGPGGEAERQDPSQHPLGTEHSVLSTQSPELEIGPGGEAEGQDPSQHPLGTEYSVLSTEYSGLPATPVDPSPPIPLPRSMGESSQWLAELLPAEAVRGWLLGIGSVLVVLALRGGWSDPERPYWSVGGVMTASALAAALAVWFRHQPYVYASGLLANLAGILVCAVRGPDTLTGFLAVNALCLALASLVWSAIELALQRASLPIKLRGRMWPFAHTAVLVSVVLMVGVVFLTVAVGWAETSKRAEDVLSWIALSMTVAACGILLWDTRAPFPLAGLYISGVLAILLTLHGAGLPPLRFFWWGSLGLAAFLILASALRQQSQPLLALGERLGWPMRSKGWPVDWFSWTQAGAATVVVVLSIWIVLHFDLRTDRLGGPLASALLVVAGVVLALVPDRWQTVTRYVALALGVVMLTELGWALLDPAASAPWLHRNTLVLMALAIATVMYGVALPRLLNRYGEWVHSSRRMGPVLAALAAVQLLIVLGHEAALYDPVARHTPLAWWGILTVALGLALLIGAAFRFAVVPAREPFGLSEKGRTLYVYGEELLAVLLLAHLRLNVPDLFPSFVGKYWPLVVMGIAFLGVGVGEWFERRGSRVLGEPLRRTGVFLPLLPLVAFWARDLTGVRDALNQNVPALSPLLRYLERLEGGFTLHAVVWFVLGLLYMFVALNRRSFRYALLAALAANFGLWVIFANVEGLHFLAHPQLWLIPLALILLVAEHLNRDKLTEAQATALRYVALTVLYLSSTADMFLAGVGDSLLLPIVLAVLSVLGILAGILLRVRAFLFQGVTFLFVVVFTMIWLAAVKRGYVVVWYISGIVLGAAIFALFALFEKRRNDVVKVVQELKKWE
jgi:hypothetical protein